MPVIRLGIIGRELESPAFFSAECRTNDEERYLCNVAQLEEWNGNLGSAIIFLVLLLDQFQSSQGAFETVVTPNDAGIIPHELLHFFQVMRNIDPLFGILGPR